MVHQVILRSVPMFPYYEGPCDICCHQEVVMNGELKLSEFLWVRLCDEHLPIADLLRADVVLGGLS